MKSALLRTLFERGFINQCTDLTALDDLCARGPIKAYIGFDLTADSLHVGSLIQIMVLRHMLQEGHQPCILLGSATTKIGDPTGKDGMRPMLSDGQIRENKRGIYRTLSRLLITASENANSNVMTFDNIGWFSDTNLLQYLRDYGPHFTINRMLTLDSVRTRLERQEPMTFLEFNYMLFQAIDFRHLASECDVVLQVGGSDQWGNIVNGVDLVRRMDDKQVFGLTTPLLTNAAGEKMGKTAGGAIWLDPEKTSPYDFWQYWRNVDDAKVYDYLRLLTDLGMDVIDHVCGVNGDIVGAKELLANEVTALVHGGEEAAKANLAAKAAKNGVATDDLLVIHCTNAIYDRSRGEFTWADLVAEDPSSPVHMSKGEFTRLVANGGVKLDGVALTDGRASVFGTVVNERKLTGQTVLFTIGKKRAYRISFPVYP